MVVVGYHCHIQLTKTASYRRNSGCDCLLSGEILRHNDNTGKKETSISNTDGDTLGEENLPVCFADTRRHHTKNRHESSHDEQLTEMACIVYGSSSSTHYEQKGGLYRTYPGYV